MSKSFSAFRKMPGGQTESAKAAVASFDVYIVIHREHEKEAGK
jgi:hypothetical protein